MAGSDDAWRRWGRIDPYYGVLVDSRFRRSRLGEHRAEFFASGQAYVEARLAEAQRLFGDFPRRRALDFGCGVGRLTIPLARQFENVTALDIAPAMLSEARSNAVAADIANVHFATSDDTLSEAQGCFDLVISCLVLQHIPVHRGMAIIARLLERVEIGGVAILQLCIGRESNVGRTLRYWLQRRVPGAQQLFNVAHGRPSGEPLMEMNAYPLNEVLSFGTALGFSACAITPYQSGPFLFGDLLMRRFLSVGS